MRISYIRMSDDKIQKQNSSMKVRVRELIFVDF